MDNRGEVEDWMIFGCFWGIIGFLVFVVIQMRGCTETTAKTIYSSEANEAVINIEKGANE